MGLVIGEWLFESGAVPGLPTIAERLRHSTRLEVTEEGAGEAATLSIPRLGEGLFDWQIAPNRVTLHSFAPAHPFLWEHLDAVLGQLGGRVGDVAHGWRPDPSHAKLRRPWTDLALRERAILRVPTIAASRPFDSLLGDKQAS